MFFVDHNAFPGVNPFIEAEEFWDDFHGRFLIYVSEAILAALPRAYDVRIEERVVISEPTDPDNRRRRPDIAVIESTDARFASRRASAGTATAVAEPIELQMAPVDEHRQTWLEVRKFDDDSLVTSIEILSPTNKVGDGAREFEAKRRALLASYVNLVDIDLLRGGRRLSFDTPLPSGDYFAFVARSSRAPTVECYPWSLRDRLPSIPIPLLSDDPDVVVDLAPAYDRTFNNGGYPRRLRYRLRLPGVDEATNGWAMSLVQAAAT